MKIDRLETHDRLKHFVNDQWTTISQGASDCLLKNPDSLALQEKSPYIYIFAHPRTVDEEEKVNYLNKLISQYAPDEPLIEVKPPSTRLLWQPRLTKPKAQTNSYLFRATSKSDILIVCWLIPPRDMWEQYSKGSVCESNSVLWSIKQFQYNREELEKPDAHDLPDDRARDIWLDCLTNGKKKVNYEFTSFC